MKPRRTESNADPSPFVREVQTLHARQLNAITIEDRESADADLSHLLRMHAWGRIEEYFASREDQTRVDSLRLLDATGSTAAENGR